MNIDDLKTIEINWDGPFTYNQIYQEKNGTSDFGIYFAFGPHRIYGENTLLYIGKAAQQTFGLRINQHLNEDWFGTETFYLGKLGDGTQDTSSDWKQQIDFAETAFIQYFYPSWNSSKFRSIVDSSFDKTLIFNRGKLYHILPQIMGLGLYKQTSLGRDTWKAYGQ